MLPAGLAVLMAAAAPEAPRVTERFLADGDRRVHVLLRATPQMARFLMAFPAGNVTAALWLSGTSRRAPPEWIALGQARVLPAAPGRLAPWGAEATLELGRRPVIVERALFHNARTVRGYTEGYPDAHASIVRRLRTALGVKVRRVLARAGIDEEALSGWFANRPDPGGARAGEPLVCEVRRRTLDGVGEVRLTLTVDAASAHRLARGVLLRPRSSGGPMRMTVRAIHPYGPSAGLARSELFSRRALMAARRLGEIDPTRGAAAEEAMRGIELLATRDAFLAGSWRFLTYFGRDTVLFLMLMGPYLGEAAWEAGLASVLSRVSGAGEAAHEEAVAEHGVLERLAALTRDPRGAGRRAAAIAEAIRTGAVATHDYRMIDTELLVLLALARMAELHPLAARRVAVRHAGPLARLSRLVLRWAREAQHPGGLVRLKPGMRAGDWRDSDEGLGGGVYPASVNACLMPAAIEAMAALLEAGIVRRRWLDPMPPGGIDGLRRRWARVFDRFVFRVEPAVVRRGREAIEAMLGPVAHAPPGEVASAPSLALAADGTPIRVLHGDGLLLLLSPRRPPVDLSVALAPVLAPFPDGLSTPVGPLVASAVTDPDRIATFQPRHYHGMVVWAWPMVLARRGVERLIEWGETDLARRLERAVEAWGPAAIEPEELWSIGVERGRIVRVPFGQRRADVTESNSLQLWSLASLAAVLAEAETAPGRR